MVEPAEVPGLALETARGCWAVRSSSATVYFLDLDAWRLLRVPGEGSTTGDYDNEWVRLMTVTNSAGQQRIDVGQRHKYLTDPERSSLYYRTWVQRIVTTIKPVDRADLPAGRGPHPGAPDIAEDLDDSKARRVTGQQDADLREIVRQLLSHLGPTIVAALAGATGQAEALRWAEPDGSAPHPDAVPRLEFAHCVWQRIAEAEGPDVARAWFICGNTLLGEDTPVSAIREDRALEVTVAVRALIEGQPDV